MHVSIYKSPPALQSYVSSILTVNAVLPPGPNGVVTPYPPSLFQSLLFYCNDRVSMGRPDSEIFEKQPLIVFNGPQLSRVNVHRQLRSIRIDFLLGVIWIIALA